LGALLLRKGEGRGEEKGRGEEEREGRGKGHEPPPQYWRKFTPMPIDVYSETFMPIADRRSIRFRATARLRTDEHTAL